MSNWLVLLIGLIIGLLIGIIAGRKNYESCQEQLEKMDAEIRARKEKLARTQKEIAAEEQHLEEVAKEVAQAEARVRMTEEIATRAETPAVDLAEEPGEGEAVAEVVDAEAAAKVDEGAVAVGERTETVSGKAAVSGATADVATEPLSKRGDVIERVTECPQKLARIKGIGRVYEDKLYQAGIGTYWQVATASAERLAEIFGIKDFQAVDLDAIQQGARALAEATDTVGKVWNGRQPDDLENLPGIGKTYEGRLYDAGICTWQKLAALTPEELAAILKAPSWNQPNYAAWIAYARARMASAS